MKFMKARIFAIALLALVCGCRGAEEAHPHILVKDSDKSEILNKVEQVPWAKEIFNETKDRLQAYVDRHQEDPHWILDRYLMNRVPGKRYTRFISDKEGTRLIGYEGDAPVPTVRVSPHKRSPISPQGKTYVAPKIEELVPNDTSFTMNLLNPATNEYERVDPQNFVGRLNGQINELAYEASVIYWLTGEEKYAKFAADILDQWVNAAVHQEVIDGPGRTGFLDIQTLGDEHEKPLVLAYDFLYDYLKQNGYSLENYQVVFERIAWTLANRGYTANNWYAAESSTMVAAALALDDRKTRDKYLDYYLEKDNLVEECGQLALPSTMEIWFTPDGHWKEPGGYHNYPVSKLIESAMMLENNGYQIFNKYPELLQAAYVMLKYSFPDLTASAFGDTGRPRQSVECLESAIRMAVKYSLPVLPDLLNCAGILDEAGLYDRKSSGIYGLLTYLAEVPEAEAQAGNLWNRTEKLDFASCYLQRNGMEPQTGLMAVVQGSTYNHNHSNGMSVELYGAGTVMGVDPGNGPSYEHSSHVRYYTQWAAHNTVVAAGASNSLKPFTGGGGTKQIGAVELVSMEPAAGEKALSEDFSYTLTHYFEGFTKTNQDRLLSIVRVDDDHGFYVDFYASDNAVSNDYLYHNIGDGVSLSTQDGRPLKMQDRESYPIVDKDGPGLRYFKSVKTTGPCDEAVLAVFPAESLSGGPGYMKMWMPATEGMSYYTASAPETKTTLTPYRGKPTPLVSIRREKEAASVPFMVVYEPVLASPGEGVVASVERLAVPEEGASALEVRTVQGGGYIFMHAPDKAVAVSGGQCCADFAVFADLEGKKMIYVGNGSVAENEDFRIEAGEKGNFFAEYDGEKLVLRSDCPVSVHAKNGLIDEVLSIEGGEKTIELK